VTALLLDQQSRWRRGESVLVEAYLARQPGLAGDGEAVLDLILHEVLLRRERGKAPLLGEYQRRFPHLAEPLALQFEVESALESASPSLATPLPTVHDPVPPTPPGDGEALPERMGRYRILGRLGTGGMGVVYRAHDADLRRDVAVKAPLFRGSDATRAEARLRFLREARAAASVRHPNVCPIYDVGEDAGRPYVVMALVEGQSLGDRLRRQGRFDSAPAVALVVVVADALAAVHAAGVVHRDVKPGNILLDHAGTPLLSDFGLARSEDGEHLTDPGAMMGTPAYMAPEQAAGELGAVGPRSDQYSLAVVLYHLLTGRTPFEGAALSVIHQIGTKAVPPPSQHRPDLDPALERLVMKALARQPQDRYADVAAFATALRAWKEQPAAPGAPAAARQRRVTLLQCGCDLFDSEALLEALDPEEQHELLLDFRRLCRDAVAPLSGTVVKETDDGLLICFGIPFALECASRRAVRAGLTVLGRLPSLNERLARQHAGLVLSARLAVHSDRAVVAEGGARGDGLSIVGPVAPVVDQLARLAEPGTLLVSDSTHQLLRGFVECTSLGPQKLKGAGGPRVVYRVERELSGGLAGAAGPRGLVPLIGRDRETDLLQERWEQAVEGVGQVVLLVGEAGIGKSRQVLVLKEHVAGRSATGQASRIVEWPCSTLSQNSSLFPVIEWFQTALDLDRLDGPSARRDRLAAHLESFGLASPEAVALLASLLSIPSDGRSGALDLSPQRQKEKTFDLLLDWLRALAERQPVLLVVEDLHWADPTTLEFLERLVGPVQGAGLLILLTFRPEFAPPWRARGHHVQVSLNRLSRRQTGELMLLKSGLPALPQQVLDPVADRTDGVPLFVEEVTAMLLETGALRGVDGEVKMADAVDVPAIPTTLQDLLMARLDRLASNLDVVQLAAVIGREFSSELLSAAAPCAEAALEQELTKLVDAELIFQHGRPPNARYRFKHALIRDAAYQSLLKKQRQQFHLRIAEVLEQRFPQTCTSQPELLAHHFSEGNLAARAVTYWQRAGDRAQQGGGYTEAIGDFRRALDLLGSLPETGEHQAQAIQMHIRCGVALQATEGLGGPQVEAHYSRAHALCLRSGCSADIFPAVYGLFRHSLIQARYSHAERLGAELLALAHREGNAVFAVGAHRALGTALLLRGKPAEAVLHLEQALAVPTTSERRAASHGFDIIDPWIAARCYLSRGLWLVGYPERAAENSHEALRTAEGLDQPFSVAYALCYRAWLHQLGQDWEGARAAAARALSLATEKGFTSLMDWASLLGSWALAGQGESEQAVVGLRRGITDRRARGRVAASAYFLTLLAEACGRAGRRQEGLQALGEAQQFADATEERFWQAEIHRLKGELLLQHDATTVEVAESCFHRALAVARGQQARSLELRAALSLARLWGRQGRPQAGRELVAAVYGTFTEGFETHDLLTARAFLEGGSGRG
jgi:TOMM system kinase/cyclase fusion protein